YEDKGDSKSFIFGISMQNHATYKTEYEGDISIKNLGYDEAEEYLSLLYQTDKSTEKLIEYFEKVDDDVMIVFFGDHQPMIDGDFYTEILGEDFYTLEGENQMKVYEVPYFIWTNYDSDYAVPEKASINYLANIMLDAAGIKKDAWFTYTGDIFEDYPVITDNFILAGDSYMAKDEVIDRLKEVEPSDTDNTLYELKKYQVYSYLRAVKD
ncbi:MAG: sulfatase-like hydrolase/transferase, partial [Anaerovoracaceae bacterium]